MQVATLADALRRARSGHCKHVTRIKNISELDLFYQVEHPEILNDDTCWKTFDNPHAISHTPIHGEVVEASNRPNS